MERRPLTHTPYFVPLAAALPHKFPAKKELPSLPTGAFGPLQCPNLVECSGVSCVSNLRVLPCRLEGFAWSSVQFAEICSRFQQSVPGHQGTSESQKNGPWAFRSCFCDSLMRYRIPGNSFPNLNMQLVYLFCTVILCDVVIVGLKV